MTLFAFLKTPHPVLQKYRMGLLAFALVFFAFPDMFLSPASLAVADHMRWDGERANLSFYSSINKRFKGFSDPGGALWQSEPKIAFMKHAIKTGESPYWNPYTGSGALGPETLTDTKFSPLTIISALLGASSLAITFVTLFFLTLGCYFLIRTCHRTLELPLAAGVAAAVAYLFNGYQIYGLSSNYSQPYLLFPIYLHALLAFVKFGGALRYIAAYVGTALVMTVTFVPTMLFTIITVTLLGMGYAWVLPQKRRLKTIMAIATIPLCAGLLVAFIYLPVWDALSLTHDSETYAKRVFFPATINAFLSVFTPAHLWGSYRPNALILGEPDYPLFMGNIVFHMGIMGGFLALLSLKGRLPQGLLAAAWIIMIAALLRIFGVPIFEYDFWRFSAYRNTAILHTVALFALVAWWANRQLRWRRWVPLAILALLMLIFGIDFYDKAVNALPVIGSFGQQYTWVVPMVCLPVLVAYGMQVSDRGVQIFTAARVYLGVLLAFFLYLVLMHPLKDYHGSVAKFVAVFLIVMTAGFWVCKRERHPNRRWPMAMLLLAFLYAEYWIYVPHLHPVRTDPYNEPPEYITYIQGHIGEHRILNLGMQGIPGELASAFQIQDVAAMTMNVPPDYVDFFLNDFLPKEYNFNNFPGFTGAADTAILDLKLASFLGVRYLLVPKNWKVWEAKLKAAGYRIAYEKAGEDTPGIRVYENPAPWPRAFTISKLAKELTIDAIKNKTITLKNLKPAMFTHYGHTRVAIDVDAPKAGTLVLTDNWYPYWHATLDDKAVKVEKIFKTFRGVAVPKGLSRVEFIYENPAVKLGVQISGIFAGITILLAAFALFRGRAKKQIT